MYERSATRGILSALAAGAPLSDALAVGARAASGRASELFRDAVARVSPQDRRAIAQLPFDPPLVGRLLSASSTELDRSTAELILAANKPAQTRSLKLLFEPVGVFASGALVMAVSLFCGTFVAPMLDKSGLSISTNTPALIALLGVVVALISFALRKDRPPLARLSPDALALSVENVLLWLGAAERVSVPGGEVFKSLATVGGTGLSRSALRSLAAEAGDDPDGRRAAEHLLARSRPDLAPLAPVDFGEPAHAGLVRLAEIAARTRRPGADLGRWLAYLAMLLVVAASLSLAHSVYQALTLLAGTVL